jgi:sugar (pentulose or hexulose) kinase
MNQNIIAIDLGNSSGRVVLGQWNGSTGALREIYRFPNEAKEEGGHVVWDIERIWQEVLTGLGIIKGPSEATLVGNVAVQVSALENSRSLEEIQAIASRLTFPEGISS